MPVLAPAAPPERPPLSPAGPVPAVFRRRLEAEWSPSMPTPLRRGRFLVFAHAVLAHADPYGVLEPRAGLDVLTSLARCACVRLDTAELLLRATVAAGLVRRTADHLTLASPYSPDWSAAVDLVTAHGDGCTPLSAPRTAGYDAAPATPQDRPRTGRTAIPSPLEGPTHAH
ncbi:hypothetical protein ACIF9R_36530 [Streptomyces sp. NPDC086080]|uniref:hypothetical protein n=1 Tax=Streptomyces sp. NPDC086080 TaxID=3365748 RepID=UPI0037D29BDB